MSFTVSFAEMLGYPQSEWQQGEFDAERRVFVAWSDRVQFLLELDTWENAQYPYSDGPANAFVRHVRIQPVGKQIATYGSYANYNYCIIQIFHSTRGPQWDHTLGVILEEQIHPAGQYQTVSTRKLKWSSDSKWVEQPDAPRSDWTLYEYTLHYQRLLYVPNWVNIATNVVNAYPFFTKTLYTAAGMKLAFPAETLRYCGSSVSCTWSLGKVARYDVLARFLYKDSGWNKFWRPNGVDSDTGGAWEQMKLETGETYKPYKPIVFPF